MRRARTATRPTESEKRRSASRRRKRETPVNERRQEIIQASARLFTEYGFEATSVRQIADEVNLIAASLYHHFPTKEDILHEIVKGPLTASTDVMEYIYKMPVDAELRLITSVIKRFNDYIYRWDVHGAIQANSQYLRRNEAFHYVTDLKSLGFKYHESLLREGMDSGHFHQNIDIYLMIGTISRMITSSAAWFRRGDIYALEAPSGYDLNSVVDFHLDCILRMVRERSRLEAPIPREFCERLLASVDKTSG
jgi:AcrR family transcriptional regulator